MQLVQVGRPINKLFAQVDDWHYELVTQYSWRKHTGLSGVIYAQRRWRDEQGVLRGQLMHTLITGWGYVDHKDHNGLNCQEYNLRESNAHLNVANSRARGGTSRFKGVCRVGERWKSCIRCHRRQIHLGYYIDEEEAARAYDAKALELFGEFACTNESLGLFS